MEEESSAVAMVNYFTNCAAQLRDRSGKTPHGNLPDLDPDSGFRLIGFGPRLLMTEIEKTK
jgi:hypothetical protein